jgi:hypothetical protein
MMHGAFPFGRGNERCCFRRAIEAMANLSRFLLALSALILLAGGLIHGAAFKKMVPAVDASNLPPFYANALKGLWLIDSATLIILAVAFAFIAIQPSSAGKWVVILLALVPLATSLLLYKFIGKFPPAHMLLAAAVAAIAAGLVRG